MCGSLRPADAGSAVHLGGWVQRTRDLGGIVFVDLRDRAGVVQASFDPRWTPPDVIRRAGAVGVESVVLIEGEVALRPAEARNAELGTGDVEVRVIALQVVGPAVTPAIPVAPARGEQLAAEELRLRHRYLDLRRADLQRNLILRHRLLQSTRRYLSDRGFLEIETPILTKPTPEGARDYLVPSRVHPGEFYALPQSPQLYKQLLMVSGFDRYFQIARCFRDEDLRADRQPEFTQIDIEASFVQREDIIALAEGLVAALFAEIDVTVGLPLPSSHVRGGDGAVRHRPARPRYALELFDASDVFRGSEFGIARAAIEAGGRVRGVRLPQAAGWSRKQVDELEAIAKSAGAGGLIRLRRASGALEGPAAKFLAAAAQDQSEARRGRPRGVRGGAGSCLQPGARSRPAGSGSAPRAHPGRCSRVPLGARFPAIRAGRGNWGVWPPSITRSPRRTRTTCPSSRRDPARVRAVAYDVVLNGTELGGGSIRISDPGVQESVFRALGIEEDDARARFGFLLEGLRAGAPPHGGIAFGFDRIAMTLAGATSLARRDRLSRRRRRRARCLKARRRTVPARDLSELHLRPRQRAAGG